MPDILKSLTYRKGFITIDRGSGPPADIAIADILRAADIPVGLTHAQVDGIRLIANLMAIFLRALIAKDILGEDLTDDLGMDWDLEHIIYALESLGGTYHEPDLDNVEVA